jgi:transmembrane sensor
MRPPPDNDPNLRERAQYWVTRLVAQDIDESELNALEAWLDEHPRHARAFARERALWQDLVVVSDALVETPPAGVSSISRLPLRVSRHYAMRVAPMAMAASLLLAFFGPSLLLNLRADHRTGTGEVHSLSLPDGTRAILDSNSAISLDFKNGRRVVHLLNGRAWFDVHHESRPFVVEALGGETRDIGTGFEVRRDGAAVEVGVTQGTVQVNAPTGTRSAPLHAGRRVRYTASELIELSPLDATEIASWRNGELLLEGQLVDAAIAEVSRYRAASVWALGDFSKLPRVSGLFLTDRPDEALETIARMRGLTITTLPGGHLIIRPGSETRIFPWPLWEKPSRNSLIGKGRID